MKNITSFDSFDGKALETSLDSSVNSKHQDSFFKALFKEPYYQKLLYDVLHPEDHDVTESDFQNVELENIFTIDMYNDVCFLVKNRMIILIEHQSTVNPNMPLRMLLYLAEEYKRLLKSSGNWNRLLSDVQVQIPVPEFYVVYTGTKKCPSTLFLHDAFPTRKGSPHVSVEVPVYTVDNAMGILSEFTSLIDQIRYYQKQGFELLDAIKNTLDLFKTGYEISKFLRERNDIMDIMNRCLSQEEIMEVKIQAAADARAIEVEKEVTQRVTQQVTQQVTRESIREMYTMLSKLGFSEQEAIKQIADAKDLTERDVALVLSSRE